MGLLQYLGVCPGVQLQNEELYLSLHAVGLLWYERCESHPLYIEEISFSVGEIKEEDEIYDSVQLCN